MGRRKRRASRYARLLVLAAIALALAGYLFLERAPPPAATAPPRAEGVLRVHYVDVGQGDGTIWELPDGSLVVYDCGPPAASARENPMVRYLQDELGRPSGSTIAALVVSHGHVDHAGGCDEIFEAFAVERIYEAWYEGADAPRSYRRFQEAAQAEGAPIVTLRDLAPGSTLELPSARAELLWPRAFASGGWERIAEASLVVRLEHGQTSFCFQGDIEQDQEAHLTGRCDVYLVGHHGSRTASGAAWLARMAPSIAVVSYGDGNAYGHPHPETVCRIADARATLLGTGGKGDIIVESDGASVRVVRGQPEATRPCL